MDNNEILFKLSYALDIKNTDIAEIFKLGGVELSEGETEKMLIRNKDGQIKCSNSTLEAFLNGYIIFKRGKQELKPDQLERPILSIKDSENLNNIMLKKLKIALSLSSDEMLDIFAGAGAIVTKGELSALFRKEGHKHYKECDDKYAMNFLKGLTIKNRGRLYS